MAARCRASRCPPLPLAARDIKAEDGFLSLFSGGRNMMHGGDTNQTEAAPGGAIDPAALPIAQASRLLGLAEDALRGDIEAGAPLNADGTMHLVHYAAWLNLMAREDADGEA